MIVIVSSNARELRALAGLVAHLPCAIHTCISVAKFRAQLRKARPAVLITRARLMDGYSDDIFALLADAGYSIEIPVIVLAAADCNPREEARQLALDADCVLRDPLRAPVFVEYVSKFVHTAHPPNARPAPPDRFALAGAIIAPGRQELSRDHRSIHVSPMEIALARLLAEAPDRSLSYETLYDELFNRAFGGDTSNLRVLLGKLVTSYRKLGLNLRNHIRVTPKSGYCYEPGSILPKGSPNTPARARIR